MGIRTTVTLDEDVIEGLKQESRARGIPFRRAINDLLRSGLLAAQAPAARRKFRVKPRKMGIRAGLHYDSISSLLELGEGEAHR